MALDVIPVGSILAWSGPIIKIPANYKLCDGTRLDRTVAANQALFDAIGTTWGGDGANQFFLPDLRGVFLRGVSGDSNRDPDAENRSPAAPIAQNQGNHGNAVGSNQDDAVRPHAHSLDGGDFNLGYKHPSNKLQGGDELEWWYPNAMHSVRVRNDGSGIGSESRPKNAAVYWIIRWQ